METLSQLQEAVVELRGLLARPDNDFSWSSWTSQEVALLEMDQHLEWLRRGAVPDLWQLVAPTGPAQEVSLSSGWGNEYLLVAERIETALART